MAWLCSPRVGRRIEGHGGRGVLALSALVIATGLGMLGLLPGLWGWVLGWLVLGCGMAMGLYEAAFATLGRYYGQAARRGITTVTLFAGFASTIDFPIGTALMPLLGWRGLCLVYAAALLLVVLPIYWLAVPPGIPPAPDQPKAASGNAPALAWARRAFILLAVFFTLRASISAVFAVHLIVLMEGLGLAIAIAVAAASLVGAAQVGGRLLEFTLGSRVHPLIVARAGALLLPAGVAALVLAGPIAALPFALAYGASNGILTISRGAVPLSLFGAEGYAVLMGRLAMPILVTQAVAPTLATPLVESLSAMQVFAIAGVMSVIALASLFAVRRRPEA